KTAPDGESQIFTVMTGLGFDAAVMADTNDELKSRLGWLAYIEAGSRKLAGKPSHVKVTFDDDYRISARVRSVLGGNCGRLQGGIQLLPQAVIDDGMLDVLIVSPKNLGQWVGVLASIAGRRASKGLHTNIRKCQKVVIESGEELDVQLDGDPIGRSPYLEMEVRSSALTVRVPTVEQRKQSRGEAWPVRVGAPGGGGLSRVRGLSPVKSPRRPHRTQRYRPVGHGTVTEIRRNVTAVKPEQNVQK